MEPSEALVLGKEMTNVDVEVRRGTKIKDGYVEGEVVLLPESPA